MIQGQCRVPCHFWGKHPHKAPRSKEAALGCPFSPASPAHLAKSRSMRKRGRRGRERGEREEREREREREKKRKEGERQSKGELDPICLGVCIWVCLQIEGPPKRMVFAIWGPLEQPLEMYKLFFVCCLPAQPPCSFPRIKEKQLIALPGEAAHIPTPNWKL